MQIFFDTLPEPVVISGCSELGPLFARHFAQWPFSIAEDAPDATPLLSIHKAKGAYRVRSGQGERAVAHETAACLLCDVGIDLAQATVNRDPALLCLHSAAVAVDGKLLVFPNVNHAGKSLLAACFLSRGQRLFADDLLAITEDGAGRSFGLPPRLRLPLPASCHALRAFTRQTDGFADAYYRFLYPGAARLASFGAQLPIGALIIPERKKGAKARLTRISQHLCLQYLVYQFQLYTGQARRVFERARYLSDTCPAWMLTYASAEEAADFVLHAFPREALFSPDAQCVQADATAVLPAAENTQSTVRRASSPEESAATTAFRRLERVWIQEDGHSAYLFPDGGDDIVYLNPLAHAVWQLLAEPLSEKEAASLLASVYPQVPYQKLERDMAGLFADLAERDLIFPC